MNKNVRDILTEKVLFSGYYGRLNTGDDSFCVVSAWGANKYWKTKDIRFLCRNLPVMPLAARAALANKRRFRGQGLIEIVYQLTRTPILVFAGGSIFHSELRGINTATLIRGIQRFRGFKIGAIGVSLGPYRSKNARRSIEGFLSRFSFLVLRDRQSFDDASSMNLPFAPVQGFDLAALLPQVYGPVRRRYNRDAEVPVLGVSVCHSERYHGGNIEKERKRESLILNALMKLAQYTPVKIRFFVFNGEPVIGDEELTNRMAGLLEPYAKVEVIPYSSDPRVTWIELGQCDAALCARLHAAIFAYVAQVPFLMVEYHRKCTDFLLDIKYPEEWRIGDMDISPTQAALILRDMLENKVNLPVIGLEKLTRMAERNFTNVLL